MEVIFHILEIWKKTKITHTQNIYFKIPNYGRTSFRQTLPRAVQARTLSTSPSGKTGLERKNPWPPLVTKDQKRTVRITMKILQRRKHRPLARIQKKFSKKMVLANRKIRKIKTKNYITKCKVR